MGIIIHKDEEFQKMRKAGNLAAKILDHISDFVEPGITTNALDKICHEMILDHNAIPACLGYRGSQGSPPYPKVICTSVNNVICHGIPNDKELKDGDILNIDITVILDGYHGDTSRMYWAGEPSIKAKRLSEITYQAMMLGIEQVKPGAFFGDIGHAIQTFVEGHGYSVVRDYCGHGIGKTFHAEPSVVHYGSPKTGSEIKKGMFFTVEPMVNAGRPETKLNQNDGWTVTTRDRSLSAQFEHTIGVTDTGYEIFTTSPKNKHCPPYNSQ
ncbi:MAG: type I methionyl aminopeptidase [Rickettsiales bacterium]